MSRFAIYLNQIHFGHAPVHILKLNLSRLISHDMEITLDSSEPLAQEAAVKQLRLNWKRLDDEAPDFVGKQRRGTVTLVGHRVFYASKGGRLSVFSLQNHTWIALGKVLKGLDRGHSAQLVADKIYYFGLQVGGPLGNIGGLEGVIEYDILSGETNKIQNCGEEPPGKLWMSSVFAPWRNEIISFGGTNVSRQSLNLTHAFNVETKVWKRIEMRGKLPGPKAAPAAAIYGTKMYVYGGYPYLGQPSGDLRIAELGNFVAPFWTQVKVNGEVPPGQSLPSVNFLGGLLVVLGGSRRTEGRIQIFVPQERIWHTEFNNQSVEGDEPPNDTSDHLGLTLSTGILYFTQVGIYELSRR